MNFLSQRVESLILQHDTRGTGRLRQHLETGYCQRAARLLQANKGAVIIGTGFPVAGSFESDGPIGAIALYQVLQHLDFDPVLVCAPPISSVLSRGYLTYEIPIEPWEQSVGTIKRAIKELGPSLVVSIERPGVTADGCYYNMHGKDITAATAKFDLFLLHSNCPSLAFGDGGNEIGMGNVSAALKELGINPSVSACDELVISSVSNWGVYGVIAMLSRELGRDLFTCIDTEAIARYLLANGCLDGVTSRSDLSEDGFPIEIGIAIIQELRDLVFPQTL